MKIRPSKGIASLKKRLGARLGKIKPVRRFREIRKARAQLIAIKNAELNDGVQQLGKRLLGARHALETSRQKTPDYLVFAENHANLVFEVMETKGALTGRLSDEMKMLFFRQDPGFGIPPSPEARKRLMKLLGNDKKRFGLLKSEFYKWNSWLSLVEARAKRAHRA